MLKHLMVLTAWIKTREIRKAFITLHFQEVLCVNWVISASEVDIACHQITVNYVQWPVNMLRFLKRTPDSQVSEPYLTRAWAFYPLASFSCGKRNGKPSSLQRNLC